MLFLGKVAKKQIPRLFLFQNPTNPPLPGPFFLVTSKQELKADLASTTADLGGCADLWFGNPGCFRRH